MRALSGTGKGVGCLHLVVAMVVLMEASTGKGLAGWERSAPDLMARLTTTVSSGALARQQQHEAKRGAMKKRGATSTFCIRCQAALEGLD